MGPSPPGRLANLSENGSSLFQPNAPIEGETKNPPVAKVRHEQNIDFAGPTDLYIALIDQYGHPLTHFFNGNAVAEYNIVIESPYHCAADSYQP
jgi:hypothetical protein